MSEKSQPKPLPELAACPFCGSQRFHRHGSASERIVCRHYDGCQLGGLSAFEEKHADRWNTRPAPIETPEELES